MKLYDFPDFSHADPGQRRTIDTAALGQSCRHGVQILCTLHTASAHAMPPKRVPHAATTG